MKRRASHPCQGNVLWIFYLALVSIVLCLIHYEADGAVTVIVGSPLPVTSAELFAHLCLRRHSLCTAHTHTCGIVAALQPHNVVNGAVGLPCAVFCYGTFIRPPLVYVPIVFFLGFGLSPCVVVTCFPCGRCPHVAGSPFHAQSHVNGGTSVAPGFVKVMLSTLSPL